jgi:hypothetical protein
VIPRAPGSRAQSAGHAFLIEVTRLYTALLHQADAPG